MTTTIHNGSSDRLACKPNPGKAASACRTLIRAYLPDNTDVDWADVQDALAQALAAFGLPEDYVESEGGRWF